MKPKILHNFLSDAELMKITDKIKSAEKLTSGEIAISIREYRSLLERRKNIRQLAEKEFMRLGIKKTAEGTGVLLFILLSERKFYILADENINKLTGESVWNKIRDSIQEKFIGGEFCDGILFGLEEIGRVLTHYFPIKLDDKNELSDNVTVT